MSAKSLNELISEDVWKQCSLKAKNDETIYVLHEITDCVLDALSLRIDDIKNDDGKAISFYSKGKEILAINITRKGLRIYIHPASRVFFDPEARFNVERFRFWDGSFHKTSGKYRAMSVWISDREYIPGVRDIINEIPKFVEV